MNGHNRLIRRNHTYYNFAINNRVKRCLTIINEEKNARASGETRLFLVYRNRYIIENTDFIIAYNEYHGKAYEFCKAAKGKGVKVIELAEKKISFSHMKN